MFRRKPATTPGSEIKRKEDFTKYVEEVAQAQRHQLADRIVLLQKHLDRSWAYFWGSMVGTLSTVLTTMHFFGPRHMTNHRVYLIRPMGPTIAIGITLYCMIFSVRLGVMKLRFWTLVEDYEYELKKANAHHVEVGVQHLAWLQFVLEQVKTDKAHMLDVDAVRRGVEIFPGMLRQSPAQLAAK